MEEFKFLSVFELPSLEVWRYYTHNLAKIKLASDDSSSDLNLDEIEIVLSWKTRFELLKLTALCSYEGS